MTLKLPGDRGWIQIKPIYLTEIMDNFLKWVSSGPVLRLLHC